MDDENLAERTRGGIVELTQYYRIDVNMYSRWDDDKVMNVGTVVVFDFHNAELEKIQ